MNEQVDVKMKRLKSRGKRIQRSHSAFHQADEYDGEFSPER
jgi:hypothetical protein